METNIGACQFFRSFFVAAALALAVAGCGGGGGGGGGNTPLTTSVTITPFKGAYLGGTVVIKDAYGKPVMLVSGGTISANGVAVVTFDADVIYPLVVEVTGTYYNEATGNTETATSPLRGIIIAAASATGGAVPVTIVTETAVADLQNRLGTFSSNSPVTAPAAAAALNTAGTMLGIPASTVPVFDPATHTTGDANTLQLAALAVVADGQAGSTLVDKVKALAGLLVNLGANPPTTVISQTAYDNALATVTNGPLSIKEAGAATPTPATISTVGYSTIYASYTPTGVAMVWDQPQATWDNADWQ